MKKEIYLFDDITALANRLAADFRKALAEKAASGESLIVALSGGHTPKAFFEVLASPPYRDGLPWDKVVFFWGDERCVPPDNDESNFKMTKLSLLSHVNIPEANIRRVLGENPPDEEAVRYAKEIKDNVPAGGSGFPRFDWILLGMGEDGHTASLFPGAPTLKEKEKICVVATHPQTGQKRVSITFPVIDNADRVSFLVAGSEKETVLKEILNKGSRPLPYPASMVHPADGVLEWYVDKAAAPWL
ncbi:MAG TPA: 6-phosphogluconolactonase [Thermodesulfobacteriota bacterium]|nr:6-phosphogluconolactonase [Thermodesulfobacteriota bacterium]